MTRVLVGMIIVAILASRIVNAAPPIVTISDAGVRVQVSGGSLFDAVDALARAGGFKVTYDGPRPARMLYAVDITSRTVPQALLRLLDGQNINYAMLSDLSGAKVTSLIVVDAASTSGATLSSGAVARPQPFATPRNPRVELPPVDDDPAESAPSEPPVPAPTPQASPNTVPGPPRPPTAPGPASRTSPFAARPFGNPFGPRPTPSPSP